jgi:osmoprotectant transport system permease protein
MQPDAGLADRGQVGVDAAAEVLARLPDGVAGARRTFAVELPLAVPAIMAGFRIAAVTLIGLVPIAAIVGQGGLGTFMLDGYNRDFQTPLTVGTVLVIVIAVAVDALLLVVQGLLTPWNRKKARAA